MAIVVVTGGNSGIGLATAVAAAEAGHTVYATVRDLGRAAKLQAPVNVVQMDVDSDASVQQGFTRIFDAAGAVDVLVNNAGIDRLGSIEELPLDEFRAAMETNYFGVLRCVKQVLPRMRERRGGCIVNVSSVAGRVSTAPFGPYSASKWALEAVSEALAQEAKVFGIRVAIVEPGIIATPMARRITDLPASRHYPQSRRTAARFSQALQTPTPASLVASKILEIVDGGTWQLRHQVGADVSPLLQLRASMTDEEWVELGSSDDETYYKILERRK